MDGIEKIIVWGVGLLLGMIILTLPIALGIEFYSTMVNIGIKKEILSLIDIHGHEGVDALIKLIKSL